MTTPTRDHLTRREVLTGAVTLPLAWRGAAAMRPDGAAPVVVGDVPVRNIIFMVSDGMSPGVPALAEPFSQLVRGKGTHWTALARDRSVVKGLLETGALNTMVTDSAAASTAWASGSRVVNGALNVLPDGTELLPIARLAKQAGRAVGLVTTTKITHATPAGFASVQSKRSDEHLIAPQFMQSVDVALGGGTKFFAPDQRKDGRDIYDVYRQNGYTVCRSTEDLVPAANATQVLGTFSDDHMPFTIDQDHQPDEHAGVPSLVEMTRTALAVLSKHAGGFLLQIEGGRVDHAAHYNDAAAMMWEQLAFDDAIGEVLRFTREHPDTLVVITTDHGNANPGLIGMGAAYRDSSACFERLAHTTASFEVMHRAMRALRQNDQVTAANVSDVIKTHTTLSLSETHSQAIAQVVTGNPTDDLNRQQAGIVGTLGQAIGSHTGIAWTGTSHTADLALTLAAGPGREAFATLMHHTDVYPILTGHMGIDHVNRAMTPAQALRYVDSPVEHWPALRA